MKRMIIMLLIACSAIVTISAESLDGDQKKGKVDTTPFNVKALFYNFLKSWGASSDEVYSVIKNPNTNQIESSVKITYFVANVNTGSVRQDMSVIGDAFKKDESKAYQLLHLSPSSKESFSLKVFNENGQNANYLIRAKEPEEMWLLCAKNPENPKLRDAYAIKWTYNDNKSKALGAIYQITSLRPDIYSKNLETSKKTFKIVGRVDENIKDSLYNIYIAESAEALEAIGDDDYVACVPVVNKRFEYQTELDRPMAGRLRCIFPNGELCSAWINLDFVPGETYNITVHNGYYDEDRDYERRVGRYSGKSLLNDKQKRGIDDVFGQKYVDVVVDDTTTIDSVKVVDNVVVLPPRYEGAAKDWRNKLSPVHQMQLAMKVEQIGMSIENIKAKYKTIGEVMNGFRSRDRIVQLLDQILQQNKELDKKYQELIQLVKKFDVPATDMPDLYKAILEFYTEQNKALNELYKDSITNGKSIRKLHEYVTKQTEKYIKEMEKSLQ